MRAQQRGLQYGRRRDAPAPRRSAQATGCAQEKASHRRVGAEADGALARSARGRCIAARAARWASAAQYGWYERTSFGSIAARAASPAAAPCASATAQARLTIAPEGRPERDQRVVERDDRRRWNARRRDDAAACADWIAASSWNAPGAPSAAARASADSPSASSSRSQSDVSCAQAARSRPRASRRARTRDWQNASSASRSPRLGSVGNEMDEHRCERRALPRRGRCFAGSVPATSSQPVP